MIDDCFRPSARISPRSGPALLLIGALVLGACGSSDVTSAEATVDSAEGDGEIAARPDSFAAQEPMSAETSMAQDQSADAATSGGTTTGLSGATSSTGATASGGSFSATGPAFSSGPALPQDVPAGGRGVIAESAGVNGFVATADDPLSTFAMDVDTASYTLARSWIESGQRPPTAAVRPEEFVNAFDYDDPSPKAGWGIATDVITTPWNAGTSLVRIGLSTPVLDPAARPDATLTFVVDTSGSMEGQPLQTVKDALLLLVKQLRPSDRIGIVEYGSQARLVLQPTPIAESDEIVGAITGLQTNGSTFAQAGLALGYQIARGSLTPNGVDVVVLASDGVANVGDTGPDGILATIGEGVDQGINLLALGVGNGTYNDTLMEQLANRGNGAVYYIQNQDDARRLFVDKLESTLVVVAKDSKVQVAFNEDTVRDYRLIGYENRDVADDDFRNDTVDAGEVGAGHQVTAIYEIVATGAAGGLGEVQVRWEDPDTGEVTETSAAIDGARAAGLDTNLGTAVVAAGLAELLRGSPHVDGLDLDRLIQIAEDADVPGELLALVRGAAKANPAPGR